MRVQGIVSPDLNIGIEILLNYHAHFCDVSFENLTVNQDNVSQLMVLVRIRDNYAA